MLVAITATILIFLLAYTNIFGKENIILEIFFRLLLLFAVTISFTHVLSTTALSPLGKTMAQLTLLYLLVWATYPIKTYINKYPVIKKVKL